MPVAAAEDPVVAPRLSDGQIMNVMHVMRQKAVLPIAGRARTGAPPKYQPITMIDPIADARNTQAAERAIVWEAPYSSQTRLCSRLVNIISGRNQYAIRPRAPGPPERRSNRDRAVSEVEKSEGSERSTRKSATATRETKRRGNEETEKG